MLALLPPLPEDIPASSQPQRGLENNPGKDGKIFNDTHPYFPKNCYSCPFNKGFRNRATSFFNTGEKDCQGCRKIDAKLPSKKADIEKLTPEQKHEIYSRPLEQQFQKVARNVQRHILKGTDEEDYQRVFNAAKLYGKKDQVLILPEIHAKEKEIRARLGVPTEKKIADLKVGYGWVDVKSPEVYRKIIRNANQASEQGAIACITDDRIEINVNSLLRLSKRILENGYYKQNEIHFKVKGSLYKYNSQGLIPG